MKILHSFANRLSVRPPLEHENLALFPVFAKGLRPWPFCCWKRPSPAAGSRWGRWARGHRWDHGAQDMRVGELAYPELRRQKAEQVHASLRAAGRHRSDQFAVWRALEERLQRLPSRPPTSRMNALYEQDRKFLEEARRRLPWPSGAGGVVAAVNGNIVCADLFDSPATLQRLWPRLVASYALDARAQRRPAPSNGLHGRAAPAVPTVERISRFLYLPQDTPVETFASPGIGQSLRFRLPDRTGSALVLEEAVVHLEVFPVVGQLGRERGFAHAAAGA